MLATYRLSKHSASFEFFNWLVMVKAAGASKIVFDTANPKTSKFSRDAVMERFRSIIEPGPALAGLASRLGTDNPSVEAHGNQILPWWNSGGRFERLRSVRAPVPCAYTVTIRDNETAKSRNSNREAWLRFADELGAVVIEDYRVKPIHLHDRIALYAGARMNFGVCNGPTSIIALTSYPVTMFVNTDSARNNCMRWGLRPGSNYPWMLPGQRMVWQTDELDNLRRVLPQI